MPTEPDALARARAELEQKIPNLEEELQRRARVAYWKKIKENAKADVAGVGHMLATVVNPLKMRQVIANLLTSGKAHERAVQKAKEEGLPPPPEPPGVGDFLTGIVTETAAWKGLKAYVMAGGAYGGKEAAIKGLKAVKGQFEQHPVFTVAEAAGYGWTAGKVAVSTSRSAKAAKELAAAMSAEAVAVARGQAVAARRATIDAATESVKEAARLRRYNMDLAAAEAYAEDLFSARKAVVEAGEVAGQRQRLAVLESFAGKADWGQQAMFPSVPLPRSATGEAFFEALVPKDVPLLPAPEQVYGPGFVMKPSELRQPLRVPRVNMAKTKALPGGGKDLSGVVSSPRVNPRAVEFRPGAESKTVAEIRAAKKEATAQAAKAKKIAAARATKAARRPVIKNEATGSMEPGFVGDNIAFEAGPISAEVVVSETAPSAFRNGWVDQVFGQVKRMAKSPMSKSIVDDMEKIFDYHHGVSGRQFELLRDKAIHRLSAKERELLTQILEKRYTGPVTPGLQRAASELREMYTKFGDEFEKLGMMVEMPDGTFRPWSRIADYSPRMLKTEIAKILWNDSKTIKSDVLKYLYSAGGKITREAEEQIINNLFKTGKLRASKHTLDAINGLMRSNIARTPAEAMAFINKRTHANLHRFFGNVDAARTAHFPAHFYEQDAVKLATEYIYGASRRLAEMKVWGARNEKLLAKMKAIAATDAREYEFFNDVADIFVGNKDRVFAAKHPTLVGLYNAYSAYSVASKISLGTAFIPNMTQFMISSLPVVGVARTAMGAMKVLFSPSYRASLRETGILVPETMRRFMQSEFGGASERGLRVISKPFTGANVMMKYMAAAGIDMAWDDILRRAATPGVTGHGSALRTLKRLGLTPEMAATEIGRSKGVFRFASNSQLQRNLLEEPILLSQPVMRPFVLFKRFGIRQAHFINDWVFQEARHGNVIPILRLGVAGYAGGEFVGKAKDLLKQALSGEAVFRPEEPWWKDFLNNWSQVGALGVFTDLMRVESEVPAEVFTKWIDNGVFGITPLPVHDVFMKAPEFTKRAVRDVARYGTEAGGRRVATDLVGAVAGTLPGALAKRFKSDLDREQDLEYKRSKVQEEINNLYLGGNFDAGIRIYLSWIRQFPGKPVRLPSTDELIDMHKEKAFRRMDMKPPPNR